MESQILEYYYNGVEVKLIAEFQGVSTAIVYKRRRKFKHRYLAYCIQPNIIDIEIKVYI